MIGFINRVRDHGEDVGGRGVEANAPIDDNSLGGACALEVDGAEVGFRFGCGSFPLALCRKRRGGRSL